jgi:hypothetical protein
MVVGKPDEIGPDTVVHRVGGGNLANLRLSPLDRQQIPVGISVLLGGRPEEAAAQMRSAFPNSRKWRTTSQTVGSTTVAAIRRAGFEVVPDATSRFPNHARLIHPQGEVGFEDANLELLAQTFQDTTGC